MVPTWTPEQVWAAAACAHRINGGYYKTDEIDEAGQTVKIKNLTLAKSALDDVEQMLPEDFELGNQALTHISQRLTMKALKGQLKEFDMVMTKIVHMTEFTVADRYEVAVVASQIRSYEDSKKDMDWQAQIDRSAGHLAPLGDKVLTDVTITKAVWSNNYGIYFCQGITPSRQGVWFSYRKRINEGDQIKIRGTVVHHRDFSTQLNRVKVLEGEIA
jgi:hypothetical protein